jgi:hypothetical protein
MVHQTGATLEHGLFRAQPGTAAPGETRHWPGSLVLASTARTGRMILRYRHWLRAPKIRVMRGSR